MNDDDPRDTVKAARAELRAAFAAFWPHAPAGAIEALVEAGTQTDVFTHYIADGGRPQLASAILQEVIQSPLGTVIGERYREAPCEDLPSDLSPAERMTLWRARGGRS